MIDKDFDLKHIEEYGPIRCDHCERILRPGKVEWLELNAETSTFHATNGEVPEEDSQGMFPYGIACAKNLLAKQAQASRH